MRLATTTTLFSADFETGTGDNVWTANPYGTDNATAGFWVRGDPTAYMANSIQAQLDAIGGTNDLVTGIGGSAAGATGDVDGGKTSTRSVAFTLPAGAASVDATYDFYFAYSNNPAGDYFRFHLVDATNDTILQTLENNTAVGGSLAASWTSTSANLAMHSGKQVYFLAEAADDGGGGIVEAAIDNLIVTATTAAVDEIIGTVYRDFNADGQLTTGATFTEEGIGSVTVTAYDASGASCGSTPKRGRRHLLADAHLRRTRFPAGVYGAACWV